VLSLWWRRAAERRALQHLLDNDARFFSDIGISRATVYNESIKWFWQA
jgi:uncharacterized protein YjiS (DUF1127 family)